MKERIEYLLTASGIQGVYEREGILKDADDIAYEHGKGEFYPVNIVHEIVSAAVSEIAPAILQQALVNEVYDARKDLTGLAAKIAVKVHLREHDGLDAWHNGAGPVIARRVSEACAALGLEIDEDDVDASTGLPDAIQNAADQLEGN